MKPPKNFYSNLDRRKQGLPEVPEASAADAGKVIKVGSGGDYELDSDAGSIVMIVTLTSNYTADKTYNEILAALNNGDIVKLVDWTGRNYIYSGMTSGRICFAYLNGYYNTNESDVFTVAVDDTNTWEMFLDTITHLPDVTSADVGKVLTVDSNNDVVWERRNVIIEDLEWSNNKYFLTKNATCADLWTKVGECINNGIIPYLMIQGKQILPCVNHQNAQGNQSTTFAGYTNTYQTNMYFKECIIPNSNTNIVTVTTQKVSFT